MFGLGAGEIFLIAVIALIFIGPKKLPELAKGLGRGFREFQKAKDSLQEGLVEDVKEDIRRTKIETEATLDTAHSEKKEPEIKDPETKV